MQTSISPVCLGGTLQENLHACAEAGFDGIELFEPDLEAAPGGTDGIRQLARNLGLSLNVYQPLRDFEGVGSGLLEQNLFRAGSKFTLMKSLGVDTIVLCSNVATAVTGDDAVAVQQLRRLADLAAAEGIRVAYEALAWGKYVNDFEHAHRIVAAVDHPSFGHCLDSFHILARRWDPALIEAIPAAKIFFVQVADAPRLDIDVMSLSRHHRVFPGYGSFDLPRFLGHVMRTGYDGSVSLEIFNDKYRLADPLSTAVDGYRALDWLKRETAAWLREH